MNAESSSSNSTVRLGNALVALGLLSIFPLGPLAGVPGLLLSRYVRTLGKAGLWGRRFCWVGSIAPLFVVQYWLNPEMLHNLNGWFLIALQLFLAWAWSAICGKFLVPPADTVPKALLIVLAGLLFLCPCPISPGVVFPLPIAIFYLLRDSLFPWSFLGSMLWMAAMFVVPPHLAAYWPAKASRI